MKKNTKSLIFLALTTGALLTACSDKEVVEMGNKQYIKEGDSYTQIINETKTFLPGEHIVYYNVSVFDTSFRDNDEGWGNAKINIPDIPDGYKYADSIVIDNDIYGYTSNLVYVFVNDVTVEARSSYNKETETIGFYEPGVPVKALILD